MIFTLGAFFFLLQSPSPEAIQHAQAGAAAEQQGKLDVAATEFRKVIELQPNLASGYANLGSVYFRAGNYAAAIPTLEHALSLNPDLNATHQILGVALLIQGDAAAALPHLEKAPVPEIIGLAYLETGHLGNALTSFQIALKRQPDDPDVLYYFGRAAALASKDAFARLAKIDPKDHASAEAAPVKGPIPDLSPMEMALLEKPDDPERLSEFAKAAAAASKQAFSQLTEGHAGSARAHQLAAERYTEQGRVGDAKTEYVESLRLEPYTSGVHLAFGKLLVLAGDLPHALAEFRAECGIRPAGAEGFYYAGSTLLQLGRPMEALPALARADLLRPKTPATLLALGKAASAAGELPLAEKAFTSLLDADKTSDLAAQARAALASIKPDQRSTDRPAAKTPLGPQ